MKNRMIFAIAGILVSFAGAKAEDAGNDSLRGIGNIVEITKRPDGLYDVRCDYGEKEQGITAKDLYSGNVCEGVEGLKKVGFAGMTFAGSCQLSHIDFNKGVVGTKISIVSLAISKKDVVKGCSITNKFSIPRGYRLGLKSFNLSVSLDDWQEGEGLEILFNGGESGGVKQQRQVEKSGSSIVKVNLSRYFYTPCASDKRPEQQLAYDLLLNPAHNKMKVAGTAGVYTVEFTDAKLMRCPQ